MKSTSGWYDNGNGTDDFGFSALPGGYRYYYAGLFDLAGSFGYWWSSSPIAGYAWYRLLLDSNPDISRSINNLQSGLSVRCLRDAE